MDAWPDSLLSSRWPSFSVHRTAAVDRTSLAFCSARSNRGSNRARSSPATVMATFAPPDRLLFARGDRLMQQPFDLNRLEVTGEATPVIEQVLYNPGSRSRRLLRLGQWGPGIPVEHQSQQPVRVVRSNRETARNHRPGPATTGHPIFHRTGSDWLTAMSTSATSGSSIYRDGLRHDSRAVPAIETAPVWFPDGSKIAYRTDQGGMFEKDVTGTGTERVLLKEPVNGPDQVSADGKWILYFKVTPGGRSGRVRAADDR